MSIQIGSFFYIFYFFSYSSIFSSIHSFIFSFNGVNPIPFSSIPFLLFLLPIFFIESLTCNLSSSIDNTFTFIKSPILNRVFKSSKYVSFLHNYLLSLQKPRILLLQLFVLLLFFLLLYCSSFHHVFIISHYFYSSNQLIICSPTISSCTYLKIFSNSLTLLKYL